MNLEFEISPDPEPDEAAALIAVLEQVLAEQGALDAPPAYASRWRRAGLEEPDE